MDQTSHQTTVENLVHDDYEAAQLAALEAQFDEWDLTLQEDRTERLLRELGVCAF